MEEIWKRLGCFILGSAFGALTAKLLIEKRAHEEIEEVRAYYRSARTPQIESKPVTAEEPEVLEEVREEIESMIEVYAPSDEKQEDDEGHEVDYNEYHDYDPFQNTSEHVMWLYYIDTERFVTEDLEIVPEDDSDWAVPLAEKAAEAEQDIVYLHNPSRDLYVEVNILSGSHEEVMVHADI